METTEQTTPDPWIERAEELRLQMETLLQVQLEEYEQMTAKLEEWKQTPGAPFLTAADYEPWQSALKNLEAAHRAFDEHISSRVTK